MKFLPAALLLLALHAGHAGAGEPERDMQAALEQMVAAQDLDLGPLSDRARDEALDLVKRTGAELFAANTAWSEAEQARARRILEELAPQVVETVHAEQRKLLARIGPELIRDAYPRYFSAAEVSQLAAYYASASYKKMRPIMSKVELEARLTGRDRLSLWREFSAGELSEEDVRALREFRVSGLGQKLDKLLPRLFQDWRVYWDSRFRPLIDAAMLDYRQEFARRMAAG